MGRWAVIREDTLGTVNLFDQHCAENLGIDRPSQRPGATKTHLPRPAQRLERIIIHARDVRFHSQVRQSQRSKALAGSRLNLLFLAYVPVRTNVRGATVLALRRAMIPNRASI